MRHTCIVFLIVAFTTMAVAADVPKIIKQNPAPLLKDSDRLMLREAQLSLAQAHIARLQAEVQVKDAETRIGQLVQSLKTQYACPGCTLNNDFTWTPAPEAMPAETPSGATTPTPKGGTNQKKE